MMSPLSFVDNFQTLASAMAVRSRSAKVENKCLRSSKSQPITRGIVPSQNGQTQSFRTTSQPTSTTTHNGADAAKMARRGQNGKSKVLNWYRLPATAGWVLSARAVGPSDRTNIPFNVHAFSV